jgi:hypothetical protein
MNEDKSQSWLYYASKVVVQYDINYIGKMDVDSVPFLDKFFDFRDHSLPPPPYNKGILAGIVRDKHLWKQAISRNSATRKQKMKERFFYTHYNSLHLYVQGEMYILSKDLAEGVGKVARKETKNAKRFAEGVEDHDVSAMAFMSLHGEKINYPIKLIVLAKEHCWWRHPVKIKRLHRWRKIWQEEMDRLANALLTVKMGSTRSSY